MYLFGFSLEVGWVGHGQRHICLEDTEQANKETNSLPLSNVLSTVTSLYNVLVQISQKGICSPAPGHMAWRMQYGPDFSSHTLSGLSALVAALKPPAFADPIFYSFNKCLLSSCSAPSLGTVQSVEEVLWELEERGQQHVYRVL